MAPRRTHQSRSQEDTTYNPRDSSPVTSSRRSRGSHHPASNNTYHGLGPAQRLSGISKFWHSTSGHQYFSKSWFKEMVAKDEFWQALKGACSQTTMNRRMPSVIDCEINARAARAEESTRAANTNTDANRAKSMGNGKKAVGEMVSSIEVDDDDGDKEAGKIPAKFTCADCQEDFGADSEVLLDAYQLRICATCALIGSDSDEEKLPIGKTPLPSTKPEPEAKSQGIPEAIKIEDVEDVEGIEGAELVKVDAEGSVGDCKIVEETTDVKVPEVISEN